MLPKSVALGRGLCLVRWVAAWAAAWRRWNTGVRWRGGVLGVGPRRGRKARPQPPLPGGASSPARPAALPALPVLPVLPAHQPPQPLCAHRPGGGAGGGARRGRTPRCPSPTATRARLGEPQWMWGRLPFLPAQRGPRGLFSDLPNKYLASAAVLHTWSPQLGPPGFWNWGESDVRGSRSKLPFLRVHTGAAWIWMGGGLATGHRPSCGESGLWEGLAWGKGDQAAWDGLERGSAPK